MTPQLIADYVCWCGENPLWHPDEAKLYWLDIETGRMFRYDPSSETHEQFYEGETVGGFTIQEDGSLLLFMERGAVKRWHDGELTTVINEIAGEEASRFNDVIADPLGRVFCGTMPSETGPGSLYRLDTDGTITRVLEDVLCSNGMGFTPDRRGFYFTDSERYEITLFDYEAGTGALSNRRLYAKNPESEGLPDGMTVDAEGFVWSARWDGNRLVRLSPSGEVVLTVDFPVKKVSSVVFGGPDYTDLYITTAGGNAKETDGEQAGGLFRIRNGGRGVAEFRSKIKIKG